MLHLIRLESSRERDSFYLFDTLFKTCGSNCSNTCETDCSFWSNWSDCSVSCGGGYKTKTRNCPIPDVSGQTSCPFSNSIACSTESCKNCNTDCTNWTSWSDCSASCGSGYRTRDRHCSSNVNLIECPWSDHIECTTMDCPPDNLCRSGLHLCNQKTHRCEGIG